MRHSRMTSAPPKRKKGRLTSVLLVVIILGIAAYLVGAGAAGSWIADNIINPVFNNGNAAAATPTNSAPNTSPPASASPPKTAAPSGVRTEEEITAKEISLYTLQTGAYEDKANAETAANTVKSFGGAGYIANDAGLYKVLAAGYTDQNDASDVKASLKTQGVDATLFDLKSGTLTFKIGAEQGQIDAIKEFFSAVPDTVDTLQQIIFNADKGQNVDADIASLKEKLAGVSSDFSSAVSSNETSVQSLREYMTKLLDTVGALPSSASVSAAALSSSLKYALIQIVADYSSLLSKLNS